MATTTALTHITHPQNSITACPEQIPKRVILRLRVQEFEGEGRSWDQYVDATETYLIWAGRSPREFDGDYRTGRHFAHVEPFQDPELNQTTFHVVLDIEQHSRREASLEHVPH